MDSRWNDAEAARDLARWGARWGEDLSLRTYTSRLLGAEPSLVLAGGGNTSVKGIFEDVYGVPVPALRIKASGHDLATIEPGGHVAVASAPLQRLVDAGDLDDLALAREMRRALADPDVATPSIEAAVHAQIPARFVDHTHADAVLALSNREGGQDVVREALGPGVLVLPYEAPGLALARAVAAALAEDSESWGMVWMHHGAMTWGDSARESYERMIDLVSRAESYLENEEPDESESRSALAGSPRRLALASAVLRASLTRPTGDPDQPWKRPIIRALHDSSTLELLRAPGARDLICGPPLTGDHLIRTKAWPLWVDEAETGDPSALRAHLDREVDLFRSDYQTYRERLGDSELRDSGLDPDPRVVVLPGVGVFSVGETCAEAELTRQVMAQTLAVKAHAARCGIEYEGLPEEKLFALEHRAMQQAKVQSQAASLWPALLGRVALVTGGAGAIGAGICRRLAREGAAVLVADLAGERLDSLVTELDAIHPGGALGVATDVTDEESVAAAFESAARAWGGVDLVVAAAGMAHVATLEELEADDFERLLRVNVEGTRTVLREAAHGFRLTGTGGDVILISTKNVFAPGASFGAYSASKAAAHQLARIASLELAELDVRVNMVAPDAVFGSGERRSGLWQEVGPARMRSRGLDEAGLEEYYQGRNLLKLRVTEDHVANAVLFFAARQTPTTGVTIPVDGGLPDATPR